MSADRDYLRTVVAGLESAMEELQIGTDALSLVTGRFADGLNQGDVPCVVCQVISDKLCEDLEKLRCKWKQLSDLTHWAAP